ncbi:hypothetical protein BJ138DRAFT_1106683 [Hygrophoropsis aurantiaca]|uniref:Uncharacterized protein n=1 Tax=Hygrophoropsis aurantiaca TaxID=72124 RepID=A0ACB7ZU55_9AGAM|nr:hypothetical protein BJ138DRAFT_1106683 [Hygrophoropsis aurantiaca]
MNAIPSSARVLTATDTSRMIMEYLALPTMQALGNSSHRSQTTFVSASKARFSSITRRFFPNNWLELPATLAQNKGVITGSAALEMLRGEIHDEPRDLNVIVAAGHLSAMEGWLFGIGYEDANGFHIQRPLSKFVVEFKVYKAGHRLVTLSESTSPDIAEIIVRSPSTADMTFMTAGGIVSLYPTWTMRSESVVSQAGARAWRDGVRFGSINAERETTYMDNAFMDESCGPRCPSLWRNLRSDKNILMLDWDEHYSIRHIVQSSRTEWRLTRKCANYHCNHYQFARVVGTTFWEEGMPPTIHKIEDRERDIASHFPDQKLATGYKSMLYTVSCLEPIIVNVPLIEGTATYREFEDLYVECWVRQRGYGDCSARRIDLRETFRAIPAAQGLPTEHAYTILVEKPSPILLPNLLIDSMYSPSNGSQVYGNVLVLKHKNDPVLTPCDMRERDKALVDFILGW